MGQLFHNPDDPDKLLLPPEQYVKLSSVNTDDEDWSLGISNNTNTINPAIAKRCGRYAIITKNVERVMSEIPEFVSSWIAPYGKFNFTNTTSKDSEIYIDIPDGYAFIIYGVIPSSLNDIKNNNNNIHPYELGTNWWDLKSTFMLGWAGNYHEELGDELFQILIPEKHIKVSSTSLDWPESIPKDPSLRAKCGTWIVMTEDPVTVYSNLKSTVTNWTR